MNIIEYEQFHETKSHFEAAKIAYNTYLCSIPLDFGLVPLHWHDDAEFIYIKKGKGIISIDMIEHTVSAGDIAFLLPGQVHGISQYENESMEYENIIFDAKILSGNTDGIYDSFLKPLFNNEIAIAHVFKPGVVGYESVRHYLDENENISRILPPAYGPAIKGNLFSMFFSLITIYEKRVDIVSTHRIDRLKPVIKYVELNYDKPATVAQMAELIGFSESHFMRYFKEALGVSFVSYLNDYRLTMAARLLLQSQDSILDIAQQVGFDNLSHFNRQFKKKYNKTPRDYRR